MVLYINEILQLGGELIFLETLEETRRMRLCKYSLSYKGNTCGIYVYLNKRHGYCEIMEYFDLSTELPYKGKAALIEKVLEQEYLRLDRNHIAHLMPLIYLIGIFIGLLTLIFSIIILFTNHFSAIGLFLVVLLATLICVLCKKRHDIVSELCNPEL